MTQQYGRYEILGVTSHLPRGGKIVFHTKGPGGVYAHPNDMPKVVVPLDKVCSEQHGILDRVVSAWLNKNVGYQDGGVISVWDFVDRNTFDNTATFRFVSLESAALFKMFWS